jgi:hypothetical protein
LPLLSTPESKPDAVTSISPPQKTEEELENERVKSALRSDSSLLIYVGLPIVRSATLTFYSCNFNCVVSLDNKMGATFTKGEPYYCKFDSAGDMIAHCRVELPDDFEVPILQPKHEYHDTYGPTPLLSGACLTAYVMHAEEKKRVKTTSRTNEQTDMRELFLLIKGFRDSVVRLPATIWGENCAKDFKIGDIIMVLNAKQGLFQNRLRFNVGDAASITFLNDKKSGKKFAKWAQKTLQDENSDLVKELPPGFKVWKGN